MAAITTADKIKELKCEQIATEAARGAAIVSVAEKIIDNAALQVAAAKLLAENGQKFDHHLPALTGPGK